MTSNRSVLGCAAVVLILVTGCGGSTVSATRPHSNEEDAGSGDDSGHVTGTDAGPDTSTGTDSGSGTDSAPDDDTGLPTRVPLYHRPNDSQCLQPPPAGNCANPTLIDAGFGCGEDSECTSGTNGRCEESLGPAGCFCTYDTCADDSACPSGQLCVCHGSPYDYAGNTCMPGNCRVDSDCGGNYCSPAHGTSNCGGVNGYYCHTASDECTDDTDCSQTNGITGCTWSSAVNHWTCQQILECA